MVESILEIDVSKDRIVGNLIDVDSDVRKRTMVGNDIFVDNAKITTQTNIRWSRFGCNSDVGCYKRYRRNKEIGAKAVELFLGNFEDCRWNLSRCRFETGRQLLVKFNVDEVNTLNIIPLLLEVGKYCDTFIFHELDYVSCFGELRVNMGLH